MKKGMFVICGNSIEELKADLSAMELAIANGESKGCGSVAYAMGMGGMSDEDIMTAVAGMEIGTPPTADYDDDDDDDEYCEDFGAVLLEYSDEEIIEAIRGRYDPCEIYDAEELLDDIPMEYVLEYVKDNL